MKRQDKSHSFRLKRSLTVTWEARTDRTNELSFLEPVSVHYYEQKKNNKGSKRALNSFTTSLLRGSESQPNIDVLLKSTNVKWHRLLSYRKLLLQITHCTEENCFLPNLEPQHLVITKSKTKTCNLKISWILLKVTLNFTKGVGIYIPLTRRKVDKSPDRQVESIYSTAQMAPRALSTITDYLHRSGSKKILPYWFSMLLSYC